jgi:hypothetical protein
MSVDVDERDIRAELVDPPERFGARRCDADDDDSLSLQQVTGGLEEVVVVVHDDTLKGHAPKDRSASPAWRCS